MLVKYAIDSFQEMVFKNKCRIANLRKPYSDAASLAKEFPDLKKIGAEYWETAGEHNEPAVKEEPKETMQQASMALT